MHEYHHQHDHTTNLLHHGEALAHTMPEFLIPILGGIGVALIAAPLGCFTLWQRMAYFGDSMGHTALLGVALGIITGINVTLGVFAVLLLASVLLVTIGRQPRLTPDTLLGILAHSSLAFGLLAISFVGGDEEILHHYLMGDVLSLTTTQVTWIYGTGAVILLTLAKIWTPLLSLTISADLAAAEGISVTKIRLIYVTLLAAIVALAIHVVGALLITALLILPAAAARNFTRTPESMAVAATLFGISGVIAGITTAAHWNLEAGPTIVAITAVVFVGSLLARRCKS